MKRLLTTTNSKGRRVMNRSLPRIWFEREIVAGGTFGRNAQFSHVKPSPIQVGSLADGDWRRAYTYDAYIKTQKKTDDAFYMNLLHDPLQHRATKHNIR